MKNIKRLSPDDLARWLIDCGEKPYRAKQILEWIYQKGALQFEDMTNLSRALRDRLSAEFSMMKTNIAECQTAADGTQKLLLALTDGNAVEAVLIPSSKRVTGCVSTQVGCKYKCSFCSSGTAGFQRNLAADEILDQILLLQLQAGERRLSHLVYMGIGEPFDNYDSVMRSIHAANAEWGPNIGARRITISTSGVIPGIKRLAKEKLQIELSVSLHSANDKQRSELMPINRKYPLAELLAACGQYIQVTNRQITFEYLLIAGVNSSRTAAHQLARLIRGLNCKVNLIPMNPRASRGMQAPDRGDIAFFMDELIKHGARVTLRKSRGDDIQAACGQLRLQRIANS